MHIKFRGEQPNGVDVGALHRHLSASECKIDRIKNFSRKKISIPTKFRGDRPNSIGVDVLQRHLAGSESTMDSVKIFSGKK